MQKYLHNILGVIIFSVILISCTKDVIIDDDGCLYSDEFISISVRDVFGREVVRVNDASQVRAGLDLSKLSKGIYLVNIETDSGNSIKKIIRQ